MNEDLIRIADILETALHDLSEHMPTDGYVLNFCEGLYAVLERWADSVKILLEAPHADMR